MSDSAPPRFEIFASTAPGLESIAAGELKALGIRGKQEIGGVAFAGDLERVYAANLWLRTASRVTVRLGRFHASTFFELERRAKKLPWTKFLPASGRVRLRVTCRKSKLYHSDAVAERVLAAIASAASRGVDVDGVQPDDEGAESEAADSSAQLFIVRIVHDECEISADSSGELLHRRGYRRELAKAPVRETIAAAMILASGWKSELALLDPMCGSGTIPIEAALLARSIAPGLKRRFQFMDWPEFDSRKWNGLLEKARDAVMNFAGEIIGADRDDGAIQAATRNAERAGVGDDLEFRTRSLTGSMTEIRNLKTGGGWILTNPPYGVRVGAAGDLRNLYATLGAGVRGASGWRLGVLTSDSALVHHTELSLASRFSTSNGGISVGFFVSGKDAGKPKHEYTATLDGQSENE
jgi:putative N6-adenine-specific DNA methylase